VNEMKTSGPWKINEDRFLTCTEDKFFKNVYGSNGYACGRAYGETREECEANARLIAAAPELLEACKHLNTVCFDFAESKSNNKTEFDTDVMIYAIEVMRAAITKAEE
jgi:hypothetical protein